MTLSDKPFKVAQLNDLEGDKEMLTVETIRKIKLAHGRDGKSIGQMVRDFNLSRNTVRKVFRSEATRFEYYRTVQPMPRMDGFTERIAQQLEHDAKQPKKYRRTAKVLYEQLQGQGYEGGYDAVRRFIRRWKYVPLLDRKPGALRNGAPFTAWELPEPIERIREVLRRLGSPVRWDSHRRP